MSPQNIRAAAQPFPIALIFHMSILGDPAPFDPRTGVADHCSRWQRFNRDTAPARVLCQSILRLYLKELETEEFEMQLIDFQSDSIWIQKFIETRKKLELIEAERLTSNISKNASNEILETGNSRFQTHLTVLRSWLMLF
ncbi:dimer_Tnp_hAT domain-containing protein [Trichonephila clavipes]|nr:dimer_Tnp_hAT domain-containing protein [Trichonephila clavipes]